ncbi:hypothetical protein Raf01_83760 [Rugosimonospora africana]|uniref:Uncharacterized protein n=1 Tax=Rugosimonospora africana TaxID=556532 RepID=A0A8J3R1S3_9ACTN|nr:hypothetical protein Raf01_83760 [Rugosimonospora africana]
MHTQQQRQPPRCREGGGGLTGSADPDRYRPTRHRNHGHRREAEHRAIGADLLGAGQPRRQQVEAFREAVLVAVQAGAEHLQVDPRAAARDPEIQPAAGQLVEQHRLLRQRHRVAVGQNARRGTYPQPMGAAEQMAGERQRGRARSV